VYRSYKVLLQPTTGQRVALGELLTVQCELYNAALEERRGAWRYERRAVTRFEQYQQLKDLHDPRPDVMRFGVCVARGTLSRLDLAFGAFFRRCRAGDKPGYPRFKARARWDSVRWPDSIGWRLGERRLYVQGVGQLRFRGSRRGVRGVAKTLVVTRKGRRFFAIVQCELPKPSPLPSTGRSVGLDLGLASLVTTSTGDHLKNPRYFARGRQRLAAEQAVLAGKVKGSANRRRQVARVAAAHRKIARQRADHAHKLSRALVDAFDLIIVEDLRIANMVRSAAGTLDAPGTNVAQKSGLNRSIHDAGWAQLLRFLAYKAEEAGREVIAVQAAHTSQRCAACGHVAKDNRLSQATFACQACGHSDHADINAAINILRAGLAQRRAPAKHEAPEQIAPPRNLFSCRPLL
jgi:putative transposase